MTNVKTWSFENIKAKNQGDVNLTYQVLDRLKYQKRILEARSKKGVEYISNVDDFDEIEFVGKR